MTSRLKHWKYYEALLNAYDVIMKNNGKVRDVRSLACKIKVLNGRVPGTWKWTICYYEHIIFMSLIFRFDESIQIGKNNIENVSIYFPLYISFSLKGGVTSGYEIYYLLFIRIPFFLCLFRYIYCTQKFSTTRTCHEILLPKTIYQNKFIIWLWECTSYEVDHPFLSSDV